MRPPKKSKKSSWTVPFACALAVTGLPLALVLLSHHAANAAAAPAQTVASAPQPAAAAPATNPAADPQAPAVEVSLGDALGRHWLKAEYRGDGHSELRVAFSNRHTAPLKVTMDAGLIFETPDLRNQMVVARGQTVEVPAGGTRSAWLNAAATRSTNVLADQPYTLCPDTLIHLQALFAAVDRCPEYSREAVQCAVLMLTENAPLNLFAKFAVLSGDQPTRTNSPAYKVNTAEILAAFSLVKEGGYARMNLVAAQESQLKIEAMIDPLAHAAAVKYYNLSTEQEWTYWRDELQKGDVSTRHYALYGIGRYYPDVALQMLPDWARAGQLSPLMRASAVQAMAETHKPEAISVLQGLVSEFGAATELGQSARKAIAYLENQRATPTGNGPVEFRLSQASLR